MRVASLAAVSMMIAACGTLQGVPTSDSNADAGAPSPAATTDAASDAAASDAGDYDAPGMPPNASRYVFVTSGTYLPGKDFVDLASADQRCTDAALQGDVSIRGKPFVAWLSDSKSSPSTRFVQSTAPYIRVVKNDSIADSWNDLVSRTSSSGMLGHKIDVDENGADLPSGDIPTWTATHADGTGNAANDCGDWFKQGGIAPTGDGSEQGSKWSDDTTASCTTSAHLYCFEK